MASQQAETSNSTTVIVGTATSAIVNGGSTSTSTSVFTSTSTTPVVIPSSTPVSQPPSSNPVSSSPPASTPSSSSSITTPSSSSSIAPITSTVTKTPSAGGSPSVVVTVVTSTSTFSSPNSSAAAATSSTSTYSAVGSSGSQNGASSAPSASVVAPAVIVPVIGVAIAVILGIFLWRRRKQRKEAAEMRQKEMEEYSYNPNNDPTIPTVGAVSTIAGDDNHTEGGGYRGWGTTSSAATRKASTTLGSNSAMIGLARSDSGGRGYDGNYSPNGHSPERYQRQAGSPEGLGALGAAPLAGSNRNQGVNRGISNASSAYSGVARSDTSDNGPGGFAGSPQYYDDLLSHEDGPHADGGYGQPVIRDVTARRNTRIENPAVFPQHGNAGIAQNF